VKKSAFVIIVALILASSVSSVAVKAQDPTYYCGSHKIYSAYYQDDPTLPWYGAGGGIIETWFPAGMFSVGDYIYFSDAAYDPVDEGMTGPDSVIADGPVFNEIYTVTQGATLTITAEMPLPYNPGYSADVLVFTYQYADSGPIYLHHCSQTEPTPTPTPSNTPTPTPTPDFESSGADEATYGWRDEGCETAEISCSSADNPRIYANGLHIGRCISMPVTFNSRPQMTNTITLIDDAEFAASIIVMCQSSVEGMSPPEPVTGTLLGLSAPEPFTATSGQIEVLGGSGFLGIDMGGDLSNPDAPINQWLDIATDFIGVVNAGNLLYIIGAIGGAGAVLAWAISTVSHPETF